MEIRPLRDIIQFLSAAFPLTGLLVGCTWNWTSCEDDSDSISTLLGFCFNQEGTGIWQHGDDSNGSIFWSILIVSITGWAIVKFLSRRH